MAASIAAYAEWAGLAQPLRLGWLHARRSARREIFEFVFEAAALAHPGKGWRLAPAYDMNPVPDAQGLKLNVSEADNAMDLELARAAAPYFRVPKRRADEIIARSRAVVKQWPKLAAGLKINAREQERMATAFRLAV